MVDDVIVLSDVQEKGLGDHFCTTTALKNYSVKHNKKLIIFSRYPKLFINQSYVSKSLSLNELSRFDFGFLKLEYDKVVQLYSNKGYKTKLNLPEQYCETLSVKKEHYPYFEIKDKIKLPRTIFLALNTTTDKGEKNPFNSNALVNFLKEEYKQINFLTNEDVKNKSYEELPVITAHCSGYITINTCYLHFFNNSLYRKKGIHLYNMDILKQKFAYKDIYHYKFNDSIEIKHFNNVFKNYFSEYI